MEVTPFVIAPQFLYSLFWFFSSLFFFVLEVSSDIAGFFTATCFISKVGMTCILCWLNAMTHACNPRDHGRQITRSGPTWPIWWNTISTKKYQKKNSQAWWCIPVVPATQEAEVVGESPEPRRQRLHWAKILPLHSSLGVRVRLHLKKKKEKDQFCNLRLFNLFLPLFPSLYKEDK